MSHLRKRILCTSALLTSRLKLLTITVLFFGLTQTAAAGDREQAKRLHDRLAGVPATESILDSMAADISAGDALAAAFTAMESPAFYAVTLRNFAAPWTNREQSMFVPLNDYIATVIGMVKDDLPFDEVLYADVLYIGDASLGLTPYSMTNNNHYQEMEDRHLDLKSSLVRSTQSAVTDLPAAATAGIMTTRAAAEAFFVDGTNRAMFRFTLLNHLCHDLEQVKDGTRSPDRIRQDVSRSPGGDSRIFLNNCIACHSGMDPLAQAFAYYNFDKSSDRLVYTDGQVQPKYHINATNFSPGFITPDDQWENYWRAGQNSLLGWDGSRPASGSGAKSLGQELAASDAFAQCQVEKVFRNVCFREPSDSTDRARIDSMRASFRGNNYSLKQVFAESAVYCMGD